MVFDRSEHEPEEWDPEEEFTDPEEEFTDPDSDSLTIPRVSTEDAGSNLRSDLRSEFGASADAETTVETDVSSDLLQAFWSIVLVVNAAVLAFSVGVLFLLFDGPSTNGFALVAGGVVLSGFAVRRYRNYRATSHEDPPTTDDDTDTDANTDTGADTDTEPSTPGETTSEPESKHRSPDDPDRT
ncbi:hypothetical protein QA600_08210 [Natronococcus sp. A-GB1]|uniref:DUF7322 domain-containing protein n=1 Tax=Natronococcus sp. A-GB1 TaxID=3037648 RepID=UPI00241E34FA|nr:hypothetical protein [Natronococcus sp. A-GB1]MDG5759323.1 hypothetical protein [Natronococcus sp. A-GB1]